MKLLTKAALCAAVLACPAVASAATYVSYSITSVGTGFERSCTAGLCTDNPILKYEFRFVAPEAAFTSGDAFADEGPVFPFAAPQATASRSADRISLASRLNPDNRFAADLCIPGAMGCGSTSFSVTDGKGAILRQFSGTIEGYSSFSFEADDADVGLLIATPGVPEPSTWALMLAGFGLTGYALRRRSRVAFA